MLNTDRQQLADALGIDKDKIRLLAPYVGGGFGAKLFISPEMVASALAATALGRPIKTAMTRQQVFECTERRSNTQQRIRLGATRDGTLLAIGHDSLSSNLPGQDFFEACGASTHFLYAGQHRHIHHDVIRMNWLLSGSMRAPGEGARGLALECAMDEMAEKLGLDPIAFRKLNEPEQDPEKGIPYSSRQLVRCMEVGAEQFGWSKRNATPGQVRAGEWLVGIGMAAAVRSNKLRPSQARITLRSEGMALVETDMTDIGTGTYTILAQITGEMLGLSVERVEVKPGDNEVLYTQASYGAHFAEVAVNAVTSEVRVRRMLGVFAAGRIRDYPMTLDKILPGLPPV